MAHTIANKVKGALVALFAACIAFAATPGLAAAATVTPQTVSFSGLKDGDILHAYKIVDTQVNDTDNTVSSNFVEALSSMSLTWEDYIAGTPSKETNAQTIAVAVAESEVNATKTSEAAANSQASLTLDEWGQYLIVVESKGDSTPVYKNTIITVSPERGENNTWTTVVMDLQGNVLDNRVVELKKEHVQASLNKTINDKPEDDTITGGDTVDFEITTAVPSYSKFDDRTFELVDTMDVIFTSNNDYKVIVADQDLILNDDYTLMTMDNVTTIKLTPSGLKKASNAQELTVTYTAVLSKDAKYDGLNKNHVKLTYSTDSNSDSKSFAEDTVYNVVYGLTFTKVAKDNHNTTLSGAEFDIYKASDFKADGSLNENATPVNSTPVVSDEHGVVTFNGALGDGVAYKLVETKAPAGYQKLTAPIDFTVNADPETDSSGAWVKGKFINLINKEGQDNVVENSANPVLPVTGGTGTVALTAAGVVLLAGAATVIVRSRKQN